MQTRYSRTGFFGGVSQFLRAPWFILRHPSLWVWCLTPLAINIVVVVLTWWGVGHLTEQMMPAGLEGSQWWAVALRWILEAIFFVARLLFAFVAFLIIGSVVAAPFNELLSQRTETLLRGRAGGGEGTNASAWLRQALVIIREELRRLALYLGISLGILGLSFVGVAAPIVPPLQLLVTAVFIALDYLAYPLERRGVLLLRDKLAFVRSHLAACLGFGLLMALVGLIPVINLFFFPIGAVGGTLLFSKLEGASSERV
ncbi:MAG: hypothetical protein D6691_11200 [Candidatus Hydrogenedentota bacterium]|jgi:CysZ protein|nr:MAG: hypothetical protein D6691_11200 [Candidatus Hydrogenedentota bacterium]GIX43866.1 MAG: sulfate transporter CysZ [Candidatus Sumerlaea sp.]